jgi:hypothetical protein
MPMMLYFAICHFSYPKVVHSILPRQPPDGFISSLLILVLITFIFVTMTIQTCLFMKIWKLRQYSGNGSDSGSGSGASGGDGGPTFNGSSGISTSLTRVPTRKQLIHVSSLLKEIVTSNSWILRETFLQIFTFIRKMLSIFLKVPHNISFGTTFTQLHGFTTLAYSMLTQAHANTMSSFDTDPSFWVCDNSATGHICND